MPAGIIATVDGGFATIDFLDPALRGPALVALLAIGGPESIETITRVGPRRQYRVPSGNATTAGLLDGDEVSAGVHTAGIDGGSAAALKAANPNSLDLTVVVTATAGNWKYTYGAAPTAAVAFGVSAANLKLAIEALPNVVPGEVTVTSPVAKTFVIHHVKRAVVSVASDTGTPLTGGSVSITAGAAEAARAENAENFHTPTAEYTSANKYVGTTTAAAERALAPSPFTGTGVSHGGSDAADTPPHTEIIDLVQAYEIANPKGHARGAEARQAVKEPPAQVLNASLANQDAALGSDPGGWAEQPEGPDTSQEPTVGASDGTEVLDDELDPLTTTPDIEDVVEYPEGNPSADWRRDELDAYALKVKGLDTSSKSDFPTKADVLAAIKPGK